MEVKYREATMEDFSDIFVLFGQLWPGRNLHKEDMFAVFSRGLNGSTDKYICAVTDDKVIGFCAIAYVNNFWQEGLIAYIYAMIVNESQRGKSIGTRLLEEACKLAQMAGCKKIELDSGFQREGAHKFYEKNDYSKRAFLFSKDIAKQPPIVSAATKEQ